MSTRMIRSIQSRSLGHAKRTPTTAASMRTNRLHRKCASRQYSAARLITEDDVNRAVIEVIARMMR
jgi:hypothetical protein